MSAYTAMLGRLSAATAALEATEVPNIPSDSDSESEHSTCTEKYTFFLMLTNLKRNEVAHEKFSIFLKVSDKIRLALVSFMKKINLFLFENVFVRHGK